MTVTLPVPWRFGTTIVRSRNESSVSAPQLELIGRSDAVADLGDDERYEESE